MRKPNLYCVRADSGKFAQAFIHGGYVGIGWLRDYNLSKIQNREEIYPIYKKAVPNDTSTLVIGQQVGQVSRFLLDITPGDYVITPAEDTEYIYYGVVQEDPYYFAPDKNDSRFSHRKIVKWNKNPIQRSQFSVPFQNTIRSSLTVFRIQHVKNFFFVIGKPEFIPESAIQKQYDYYQTVLNSILELDDQEFEILITYILTALGFEGSEHTGKVGDGGVDATGELDVNNVAKIKLFVQAKRYKLGSRIKASTVKALRSNIPQGGQGAFITTADYQKKAKNIALEPGFPRIGLINGEQLVDILAEHWNEIPEEFQDKLGLQVGLVPI